MAIVPEIVWILGILLTIFGGGYGLTHLGVYMAYGKSYRLLIPLKDLEVFHRDRQYFLQILLCIALCTVIVGILYVLNLSPFVVVIGGLGFAGALVRLAHLYLQRSATQHSSQSDLQRKGA